MPIKPKFPRYLLNKSRHERVVYFKGCWAAHMNIKRAKEEIMTLIREPANVGIIHLVGPTGVGKSTLLQHIIKTVYEEALPELEKRPGWIPAAYILAENPQNGVYDWTRHFIQTMESVQEVLIERKIWVPDHYQKEMELMSKRANSFPKAVRQAAQKALKNRSCGLMIVDDAHYIGKRRSGEGLINQADTIKSVADQSETLHLLAGTYDLLPLRNLNGQLGRRSSTVVFRNYKYKDREDVSAFIGVLKYFLAHLPLAETPDFSEHWEFCYALSADCVGVLKDWFVRSLDAAIVQNDGALTFELFKTCQPSPSVVSQIAEEISRGEALLSEENENTSYAALRMQLGMNGGRQKSGQAKAEETDQGDSKHASKKSESAALNGGKKKRDKIEANPRRYPVGTNGNAL